MNQVMVSVAPVWGKIKELDPRKTAQDIVECVKAGAGEVHLHPRDRRGRLTDNLETLREIIDRVRDQVDVVIQVSPGAASELTMNQKTRALFWEDVEMTTLNMTSMNFGKQVRIITPDDVQCLAEVILKTHTLPEIELFDPGDIYTYQMWEQEYHFPFPRLFNIGLGHEGRLPATPQALAAFLPFMPEHSLWCYTEIGRRDFQIVAAAVGMGASGVRVGLEDSCYLTGDIQAETNAPIVARTVKILEIMGKEPASPADIRSRLGLS